MIDIRRANINTKDYKQFVQWILREWDKVDQLPVSNETRSCPHPLLAFDDDCLTGGLTFIFYKHPDYDHEVLWINTVFIEKDSRGKGIASELIREAEAVAKTFGVSELFVYTDKPRLYEKLSWVRVSQDCDNHVLKRTLQG